MQPSSSLANEVKRKLWSVDADVQASLALSRATLEALAALSPSLMTAADSALDAEIARAVRRDPPAAQRTLDILEEMRERLQRALERGQLELALEQALVNAADDLGGMEDPGLLRAG